MIYQHSDSSSQGSVETFLSGNTAIFTILASHQLHLIEVLLSDCNKSSFIRRKDLLHLLCISSYVL